MQTAAELLVKCLIAQKSDIIYGVPGESYLSVLDALYDHTDLLRFITTRHEGGAAFMAEAYGKLTGQPGICFVTRGPGATNASIGVHTAMQDSSPMILFIGQIGREMRDREAFQEIDYRAFFGPIAKWVTEIDDPDRIPEIIARAYSTAMSGRPGPVVIALPEDMLREQTNRTPTPAVNIAKPNASSAEIGQISKALQNAKRPLIMVGGGGWNADGRRDLLRFAQSAKIPVICGFRNQDLMETTSPQYIGDASFGKSVAMKDAINGSDLILVINQRFGEVVTDGWELFDMPTPAQKIIHTHISQSELGKVYQCDTHINSCPNTLVSMLADQNIKCNWSDWMDECHTGFIDARKLPDTLGAVNPALICDALNDILDDDAIMTNGAGNFAIWHSKYLNYNNNRRLIAPQSGAMGAGLPAAIAMKSIHPERQVVCFAGDGDFQMNCNELGTAMQNDLRPIVIIFNNGSYGTIRMHQEGKYADRISGTELLNPCFEDISRAYGFDYHHVTKTDEFIEAFQSVKGHGGIIELVIDIRDIAPNKQLS
ncbi:thiamine pyrophosphate TPP-binding domain-containing protein [Amylibacter ulvae]|uniref:Thiamine pyrophosphate TPP-binding domain-containing protein n=1 Tax=Paramylibacter ulvae TaxID=1651968 RepID=A0ABQ3CS72_9RHOB|nr:thiamine pyrophosphate-dependent enzyme [Amylibacter ulvae]GHA41588.1 thiamine pyrophosphate TPP-binding domain-containing protein [Amylibacter ulvae]